VLNRRLAFVLAALLVGACAGADAPVKRRTTPSDDSEESADDDSAPRKHARHKKHVADSEEDEDEDNAGDSEGTDSASESEDDDDGGGGVEEVHMTAKERERERRRARDRAKLRREMEREDGRSRRGKTGVFGAPTDEDDDSSDEPPAHRKPAKKTKAKAASRHDDETDEADEAAEGDDDDDDRRADADDDDGEEAERKREEADRKKREVARAKQEELVAAQEAAERKKEEAARKRQEVAERRKAEAEARKAEAERKRQEAREAAERKKQEAAERKKADADRKREQLEDARRKDEEAQRKRRDAASKQADEDNDEDEDDDEDEDTGDEAEIDMSEPAKPPRERSKPTQPAHAEDADDADDAGESDVADEDDAPLDLDRIEAEDPLAQKKVAAISPDGDDDATDMTDAQEAHAIVAITDRALTLHKRGADIHAGMRIAKITFPGSMDTPSLSKTSEAFILGGSYGLTDKLEVGGDYGLSVNPGTVKGPITLRAAYSVAHGKLDVALGGALAVDFYETTNDVTMTTTSTTYESLELGASLRYHATPKLSVFTGIPGLPSSSVGISSLAYPLPPFQYQLAVGLNSGSAITLQVPLGASFQVSPTLFAFTSLNLANISLKNSKNVYAFSDFIPVAVGAFYSLHKADIGFQGGADLDQGLDYLRVDLVLRYYVR
jgi:hypothetical protein